jgi:predicted nuclease of predicted toxin-antitoxin system
MPLKFYFDTHIPKAAALQLRSRGADVLRCEDVGMSYASDEAHLLYASKDDRIVVSQDNDFAIIHLRWQREGLEHAGIIKLPGYFHGEAMISIVVRELSLYHELEKSGAATREDFYNRIVYV